MTLEEQRDEELCVYWNTDDGRVKKTSESDLYGYKIGVLRNMLECEKDERTGGYGAHITHWSANKSINIGADAIEALIRFYEGKESA